MSKPSDLVQGTLDLLILSMVAIVNGVHRRVAGVQPRTFRYYIAAGGTPEPRSTSIRRGP